jgi:hypothetical protein
LRADFRALDRLAVLFLALERFALLRFADERFMPLLAPELRLRADDFFAVDFFAARFFVAAMTNLQNWSGEPARSPGGPAGGAAAPEGARDRCGSASARPMYGITPRTGAADNDAVRLCDSGDCPPRAATAPSRPALAAGARAGRRGFALERRLRHPHGAAPS